MLTRVPGDSENARFRKKNPHPHIDARFRALARNWVPKIPSRSGDHFFAALFCSFGQKNDQKSKFQRFLNNKEKIINFFCLEYSPKCRFFVSFLAKIAAQEAKKVIFGTARSPICRECLKSRVSVRVRMFFAKPRISGIARNACQHADAI